MGTVEKLMAEDAGGSRLTYPAALLGYRVWRLDKGKLAPLHMPEVSAWQPGVNAAQCLEHQHQAPAPGCKCGFNAHHLLDGAKEEAESWCYHWRKSNTETLVIGAIAGKGSMEVHVGGFRCGEAQILALVPVELPECRQLIRLGSTFKKVQLAADYYRVPLYDDITEFLKEVNQLVDDSLLISDPYLYQRLSDDGDDTDGEAVSSVQNKSDKSVIEIMKNKPLISLLCVIFTWGLAMAGFVVILQTSSPAPQGDTGASSTIVETRRGRVLPSEAKPRLETKSKLIKQLQINLTSAKLSSETRAIEERFINELRASVKSPARPR